MESKNETTPAAPTGPYSAKSGPDPSFESSDTHAHPVAGQSKADPGLSFYTAPAPSSKSSPSWALRAIHAVGFTKVYNFALWFILAGAMTGFVLARFQYLNFNIFCPPDRKGGASPGECYWYANFPRYKIGIILHLATILPASLLAVLQFTPVIRHRFRTYHRIAGYAAIALGALSIVGVLMIAERAFGGAAALQLWAGALGLAFLVALGLALYNIKKRQIEQHRAWMLRAWVWAGCIITLRIIMIIAAQIITLYPAQSRLYLAYNCNVLAYIIPDPSELSSRYPICANLPRDGSSVAHAAVGANFKGAAQGRVEELSAALQACFPLAAWLAWALHVVGTEVYLKLTPAEAERLRGYSYQRQLEWGEKNPGNAGLTVERLGEAPAWVPPSKRPRSGGDDAATVVA